MPTPLHGAEVRLLSDSAADAVAASSTGSSGRARFSGLAPGRYEVEVSKPGYSSARAELLVPDQRRVELSIHQVFAVTGSVLFPDGRPVDEAVVFFVAPAAGERRAATMTGASYRIEGLPPALYQIQAGTPDRLYSVTVEGFALQADSSRDLVLDEMPPRFEMSADEPTAVPTSSGRGRIPKQ